MVRPCGCGNYTTSFSFFPKGGATEVHVYVPVVRHTEQLLGRFRSLLMTLWNCAHPLRNKVETFVRHMKLDNASST
jgi:hypothetical protein